MEPAIVCVVLTGIFRYSVRYNVNAPAVSATMPSSGVTLVIFVPIVRTMRHPPEIVPSEITVKQENATHDGMSSTLSTPMPMPNGCAAIIAAAMIPITFCESFNPWPILNNADETSCIRLNQGSVFLKSERRHI